MAPQAPHLFAHNSDSAPTFDESIQEALSCFRSRSQQLWKWHPVLDYADDASSGVLYLEQLAATHGATAVIPHVQMAIDSTFRVLMRADDSGGAIQTVIDELLDLHVRLCAEAPPTPTKLVSWMMKFEFGEPGDYWHLDPVRYATALGDAGLARLRRELEKREAKLTTAFDRRPNTEFNYDEEWGTRNRLLSMHQRLAVLDKDEAAILSTHLPDEPRAHQAIDATAALVEAGFSGRALVVSFHGMRMDGADHHRRQLADTWVQLIHQHRPDQIRQAAIEVFELWPTHAHASALRRAVGDQWPSMREAVLETMREYPQHLIDFVIDEDPQRAWDEAHRAEEANPPRKLPHMTQYTLNVYTWEKVAEAYAPIDAIAALRKLAEMLDRRLEVANSSRYAEAVDQMIAMKKIGRLTAREPEAVELISEIRTRYARRPALMKRMDKAGL